MNYTILQWEGETGALPVELIVDGNDWEMQVLGVPFYASDLVEILQNDTASGLFFPFRELELGFTSVGMLQLIEHFLAMAANLDPKQAARDTFELAINDEIAKDPNNRLLHIIKAEGLQYYNDLP